MPEINTTFTQGRMNLDLEEKILPNGEYRGALNIQVSTSDEDSVGSVQPIMGNEKLTTGLSQNWGSFECIGSIADEKNDVLYWFVSGENKDAILEATNKPTAWILIRATNLLIGLIYQDGIWMDVILQEMKIVLDQY